MSRFLPSKYKAEAASSTKAHGAHVATALPSVYCVRQDTVLQCTQQDSLTNCTLCRAYNRFIAEVAAGRDMSEADVRKVAQGRVWTGRDAMKHGRVDSMGGLTEAVAEARRLAGLTEVRSECCQVQCCQPVILRGTSLAKQHGFLYTRQAETAFIESTVQR